METFRDALNSANSPRLRDAIAEVVLNDSRYAEIAEQAGTSEAAIKQMFHRYHQKRRKEGGRDS
jgi:DNA-directed RNA polymerase specialized sigma24 family protein